MPNKGGGTEASTLRTLGDLQAQIEAANAREQRLVGAMLDYEKFFDRFHPELVRGLLMESGFPPGVAKQFHFLYTNLKRYIKVAGTYGAVVAQSSGVGQGCSMSIIVANLYGAT